MNLYLHHTPSVANAVQTEIHVHVGTSIVLPLQQPRHRRIEIRIDHHAVKIPDR